MRVITIPGVLTRIALLDIPGTGSTAPVRVFLHVLGSSAIAMLLETVAYPALRCSRSVLIDLPGFAYSSAASKVTKSASGNAAIRFSNDVDDSNEFDIKRKRSQAEVVACFLEHLELSHKHVIGHSMGGPIAVSLAYVQPDLVSHLTVAEPNLDPGYGALGTHII
jgi:pimeloyl-ACP methyl ester carboxylesterase